MNHLQKLIDTLIILTVAGLMLAVVVLMAYNF